MKRSMFAGLVTVLAFGLIGAPIAADEHGATYTVPYGEGPEGGENFSYTDGDEDGRVVIGRLNPVPGPISCDPGGPFSLYQVEHTLTGPVETVRATYTEALVDPYVFVVLQVRRPDGDYLGYTAQRGPLYLDGELEALLDPADYYDEEDGLWEGDTIMIQFGLVSASGCPQLNGGTARFTQVDVS